MRKKKIANYSANPDYLDYLTALRKFFTNDTDIVPVIMAFNFYINGVYGIPYLDLFRMYDENYNDIHGDEKTRMLTDDGTIGIINNQIFNVGGGSLITSLEALRIYLLDREKTYTIVYNPFINAYAEAPIPTINKLETANPVVTTNGIDPNAAPVVQSLNTENRFLTEAESNAINAVKQKTADTRTTGNVISPGGTATPKLKNATDSMSGGNNVSMVPKKKKSVWSYLTWAVYKPKPKPIYTGGGSGTSGNI